jgi:flagellar L-ring protein precursor FlgH
MRDRVIATATITSVVGLTALAVFAQERGPARAETATASTGTASAGRGQVAQPDPDTRSLMQADNGSLLQATEAPPETGPSGAAGGAKGPSYSLYSVPEADPHVLKQHDLVNIVVREESKSSMGGVSDQQRQSNFDAKVDAFARFKLASLSLYGLAGNNLPEAKFETNRQFQGTGEYDRTDTMTTRLEAEVIDVKPNGTLVLQARRHMQIDEETVNVTLTGVCRVQDVDATNSVLSTDMHDLSLQKQTSGQVRDTTKRGFVHQILDFINPF